MSPLTVACLGKLSSMTKHQYSAPGEVCHINHCVRVCVRTNRVDGVGGVIKCALHVFVKKRDNYHVDNRTSL